MVLVTGVIRSSTTLLAVHATDRSYSHFGAATRCICRCSANMGLLEDIRPQSAGRLIC